jgi:chromosome segregation ATPase
MEAVNVTSVAINPVFPIFLFLAIGMIGEYANMGITVIKRKNGTIITHKKLSHDARTNIVVAEPIIKKEKDENIINSRAISELGDDSGSKNHAIDNQNSLLQELSREISSLTLEIDDMNWKVHELMTELREKEGNNGELIDKLMSAEKTIIHINSQIETPEKQLPDLKDKDETIGQLQGEVNELSVQLQKAINEVTSKEEVIDILIEQRDKLSSKNMREARELEYGDESYERSGAISSVISIIHRITDRIPFI